MIIVLVKKNIHHLIDVHSIKINKVIVQFLISKFFDKIVEWHVKYQHIFQSQNTLQTHQYIYSEHKS